MLFLVKSEAKKRDTFKNWALIKSPQVLSYLLPYIWWYFSPSFMRIGEKLWIFYLWPILKVSRVFLPQTLLGCPFNRIKMRNWYIMSPMKIPKQLFYNFCMKFSICKYHTRRNFLNFWLREGGKNIWIFAGFPDSWLETVSEKASEFRVYKKV